MILAFQLFTFSLCAQSDHLQLELVFQQDSTLSVTANYTIQNRTDDSVYFILNPGIQPLSISAEGLASQQMAPKEGRPFPFWLLLFENSGSNKSETVSFSYSIDLKLMNHIASNWIELNVDKLWFPNLDDLDHEFTWEANIVGLYDGYSLMSYQTKEDSFIPQVMLNPEGSIQLKNMDPTPEVFIMAGANMQLWTAPNREEKTQLFVSKEESDSTLQIIGQRTNEIIEYFNGILDTKPIGDYLLVLRNTKPGEISFLQSRGNILLGNTFASGYASLSHEVAHFWWSRSDFINEPWMNESFANYSMLLYLEKVDSLQFTKQWKRIQEGSANGGSIRSSTTFDPNGMATYYFKGTKLLWELDQQIGREAFLDLLVSRVEKQLNSTDAFLELLKNSHGENIRSSFEASLD